MASFMRAVSRPLAAAARGSARTARPTRQALNLQSQRYASTHGEKKQGETMWLIGAIAATIPGIYLVSGQTQTGTGHNHGHAAHESHGTGSEIEVDTLPEHVKQGAGPGKEESGNDNEGKEQPKNATPLDEQNSDNYGGNKERKEQDGKKNEKDISPEGKDNDSGDPARKSDKKARPSGEDEGSDSRAASPEGINFKGGEKKREEDAKGGTKIRIDSDLGKNIGEGASSQSGDEMSHKQRGYSSTDTRHSVDVSSDPEKSKKGEGTVETAKIQGTVQPDRPQV